MSGAERGPGAIVTCAVLTILAIAFALLGRWQLARADFNRGELERFRAAAELPPLSLAEAEVAPAAARYRRVEIAGRYLSGHHVLLDNMTRAGRAGFEVLTPFTPGDRGILVLVNRGWVAAGPDGRRAPDVALASPVTQVSGRLTVFPRAALGLGADDEPLVLGGHRVLSFPSVAALDALFEPPILPMQLHLDADEPNGFVRDWSPDPALAQRNVGYALQWFAFAAVAAGGAVVIAWRARAGAAG